MLELERPRNGERALLVHVNFTLDSDQDDLVEFTELVNSAGVSQIEMVTCSRRQPTSKTFIGKGKLEQVATLVKQHSVDVVLFNHALRPSQERNLERHLQCRVLDRTGLILDIFAQRAQSFEGKLQVELAQLKHLSTRLVRGWTHLERQKGGIGLRGPGETQLETDRRLLGKRIKYLNNRLIKVSRQREQGRQARKKADIPTVSLVGYTNAGKSTLFNALTGSQVFAADQLFATLDPTLRRLQVSGELSVILTDTVGFIRHLPHDLVAAFRATLLETQEADLIVHVVDCADENRQEKMQAVIGVLDEVGAAEVPQLVVYNKIDLLDGQARVDLDEFGASWRIWLSAKDGRGFEQFKDALQARFRDKLIDCEINLHANEGQIKAFLHSQGVIESENYRKDGDVTLNLHISPALLKRLCRRFNLADERIVIATDIVAGVA